MLLHRAQAAAERAAHGAGLNESTVDEIVRRLMAELGPSFVSADGGGNARKRRRTSGAAAAREEDVELEAHAGDDSQVDDGASDTGSGSTIVGT